jgi:hypothetical protein
VANVAAELVGIFTSQLEAGKVTAGLAEIFTESAEGDEKLP